MKKALILVPILSLLPLGLAFADATQSVFDTLERANTAYEEALALEHGWSVTEPLMQEARQALSAGNDSLAQELADRALLTAQMALEQARSEPDKWKDRVVAK
jgi:phage shock protein A